MKAMFASAVTMIRLPRATSMPFSAESLRAMASTSAGDPEPSWYSWVSGRDSAARAASTACGGGP